MPILAKAAASLQRYDKSIYVLVPAGATRFEKPIHDILMSKGVNGRVVPADKIDKLKPSIFAVSDLALGKSGTVNMELALNGIPQIVGYKVSRFTAFLARRILRFNVDHISPVNLLLKERLVPELVQEDFVAESIVELAIPLLENSDTRQKILEGYQRLRKDLGSPGVTDRAARQIFDLMCK